MNEIYLLDKDTVKKLNYAEYLAWLVKKTDTKVIVADGAVKYYPTQKTASYIEVKSFEDLLNTLENNYQDIFNDSAIYFETYEGVREYLEGQLEDFENYKKAYESLKDI